MNSTDDDLSSGPLSPAEIDQYRELRKEASLYAPSRIEVTHIQVAPMETFVKVQCNRCGDFCKFRWQQNLVVHCWRCNRPMELYRSEDIRTIRVHGPRREPEQETIREEYTRRLMLGHFR